MTSQPSQKIKTLMERIQTLEQELQLRNQEIIDYRREIAQANETLKQLITDMNQELQYANHIQKTLCPTEIPTIPGFEFSIKFAPGTETGGDYYDLIEYDDKMKFGILISSCSGYTLSALFMSVLIKMFARIKSRKGLPPNELIEHIIQELKPQASTKDTAQLFYATIDRRTYQMTYSGCGSIAALIFSKANGQWTPLEPWPTAQFSSSTPLTQKIPTHTVNLSAEDTLILCTQGIYEAKNQKDLPFGLPRLKEILQNLFTAISTEIKNIHEIRNEVFFQVEKWSESEEIENPRKDQLLLVCRVQNHILKLAPPPNSI